LPDRVAVLDRGRLVAVGSPAELTGSGAPRLRFRLSRRWAQDLLAVSAWAAAHDGGVARVVATGAGAATRSRAAETPEPLLIAGLAAWCAERGLLITELRLGAASLEERYLELVGADVAEEAEG
jgi:ABC-2 type transport system ATP-binding protein